MTEIIPAEIVEVLDKLPERPPYIVLVLLSWSGWYAADCKDLAAANACVGAWRAEDDVREAVILSIPPRGAPPSEPVAKWPRCKHGHLLSRLHVEEGKCLVECGCTKGPWRENADAALAAFLAQGGPDAGSK